jgi:hypothetical protein
MFDSDAAAKHLPHSPAIHAHVRGPFHRGLVPPPPLPSIPQSFSFPVVPSSSWIARVRLTRPPQSFLRLTSTMADPLRLASCAGLSHYVPRNSSRTCFPTPMSPSICTSCALWRGQISFCALTPACYVPDVVSRRCHVIALAALARRARSRPSTSLHGANMLPPRSWRAPHRPSSSSCVRVTRLSFGAAPP